MGVDERNGFTLPCLQRWVHEQGDRMIAGTIARMLPCRAEVYRCTVCSNINHT